MMEKQYTQKQVEEIMVLWQDSGKPLAEVMANLPTVQAPVVPSSAELAEIIASAKREYNVLHGSKALPNYAVGESAPPLIFAANFIGDKIRAHLLTHGTREQSEGGVNQAKRWSIEPHGPDGQFALYEGRSSQFIGSPTAGEWPSSHPAAHRNRSSRKSEPRSDIP